MKKYGTSLDAEILQSTVYVEPMDEEADGDGAWEARRPIFGVVSSVPLLPCERRTLGTRSLLPLPKITGGRSWTVPSPS